MESDWTRVNNSPQPSTASLQLSFLHNCPECVGHGDKKRCVRGILNGFFVLFCFLNKIRGNTLDG